jgi:hypothetical protein
MARDDAVPTRDPSQLAQHDGDAERVRGEPDQQEWGAELDEEDGEA